MGGYPGSNGYDDDIYGGRGAYSTMPISDQYTRDVEGNDMYMNMMNGKSFLYKNN